MERIRRENALNIPNLLTMLRIALLPVIIWCFRRGYTRYALLVYLAAMLTDAADGVIARRLNQITAVGKLLDPIADKLCLLTLLSLFASDGQIPLWMLNIVLLKEAILVAGSVVALKYGVVVSALLIGKLTTFTFVSSMVMRFLAFRGIADILLGISLAMSFAALIWYAAVFVKQMQQQKAIA